MSREKQAADLADALESFSAGNLSEREFRAKYQKADDSALLLSVIWPNLEGEYYLMQIRNARPEDGTGAAAGNGNVFHTNIPLNF